MDNITLKKTIAYSRQILFTIVDINRILAFPFFDTTKIYSSSIKKYDQFRINDKIKFTKEIYRLEQAGFIKKYIKEKEENIILTRKGKKAVRKYITEEIDINIPQKWDKKWRIVIFDIPKDKNKRRDVIRNKIEKMGFYQLQKSVYVHPFDCIKEINYIKKSYYLEPYVQYIVADRIESEKDLIKIFIKKGILSDKML